MLVICKQSAIIQGMTKTTSPKPRPVPVRLPPELVERLDRLRNRSVYASREAFVRYLLDKALAAEERKP